ncbi:MAG: hypothetical protein IJ163_09520, partial [Bacteroidaceae bacterium]|nr:hypothetical protein [Bacteroidaceae bacterium]
EKQMNLHFPECKATSAQPKCLFGTRGKANEFAFSRVPSNFGEAKVTKKRVERKYIFCFSLFFV